jgi:uncharacterized protein YcgI (DUF1989 family)
VSAGTEFRVVDVEGGQVGDLFAFCADDVGEYASASHTRPAIGRLLLHVRSSYFRWLMLLQRFLSVDPRVWTPRCVTL